MTREMAMAYARARASYTDWELLEYAIHYHRSNPQLAWEYRQAWAIRCIEKER